MEGLICFFMSRAGEHIIERTPFYRETRNCIKTFLKFFSDAMASLIR